MNNVERFEVNNVMQVPTLGPFMIQSDTVFDSVRVADAAALEGV